MIERLRSRLRKEDVKHALLDLNHVAASSTAALPQTQVVDGKLARVLTWYDNEWGFATRMADTALVMSKLIKA